MKERPILFNAEMVRAILSRRKTQTRRPITKAKLIPVDDGVARHFIHFCPYGQPGDRLWVKETFRHIGNYSTNANPKWSAVIMYEADNNVMDRGSWENLLDCPREKWWNKVARPPWKPSLFMPRWASRIDLEIKGVRIERVQDITEGDAMDEGRSPLETVDPVCRPGAAWFRELWDGINEPRGFGWEMNPFVWVIEFRRV